MNEKNVAMQSKKQKTIFYLKKNILLFIIYIKKYINIWKVNICI